MNINYKAYVTIFLITFGAATQMAMAAHSSKLQEVRENIASQAEAIQRLTEIVDSVQAKLGVQLGNVELAAMEKELQKVKSQDGGVQEINNLLETAKIQSKVLNQLADLVVRLQHQVGIQPEGTEGLAQEPRAAQPVAPAQQ